jgi:glutamine synthetase
VNAEVAKGQWEFQIFGKGAKRAADELWIARYLMLRLCERHGVDVNFHPKPLGADLDWNGSGLHTNFSTKHMRENGGEEYFTALMNAFSEARDEHIACYGPENDLRLTGLHETAAIDEFTYGVADRARRSASRTASSTAATAAISRIAGRTRWRIRIASPAGSCRRSSRSPRRR